MIFGGALILCMFVAPGGIIGLVRRVRNMFVRIQSPRVARAAMTAAEAEEEELAEELVAADPAGVGVHDKAWTSTSGGS